jgi:hypothetical protein
MHYCPCCRGRQSGRHSARIPRSQSARHPSRAAPSTSMPHPAHSAPADPTSLPSTLHWCYPHRRRSRPTVVPPQNASACAGGQPAVCIRLLQGSLVALTRLFSGPGYCLRAGALAPRRCGTRPPQWRLQRRLRRMTVAVAQRTAPAPRESISTRAVGATAPLLGTIPPRTTSAPLTAQQAWLERAHKRVGMASHGIVTRSSPHAFFTALRPLAPVYPPHTPSRGRVPRNSFAPARATLHTPSSRHARTNPLNVAMRAHNSGIETARSTAQLSVSVRGGEEMGGARVVV